MRAAGWGVVVAALLTVSGCSTVEDRPAEGNRSAVPAGVAFDYQLGGGYAPPGGVELVARDSTEKPASGAYNLCYVNGFQTQPGGRAEWLDERADLVLHDQAGDPVADENWPDELILDTSTAEKRTRIAEIVAETTRTCAESGFDAVEFDNLDSYLRSAGTLTPEDNLALAAELVATAHREGLSAAQKNTAELSGKGKEEAGFDFAVTEECVRWDECGSYQEVYGELVFDIEYTDDWPDGEQACDAVKSDTDFTGSVTVRDRALVPRGESGYYFHSC